MVKISIKLLDKKADFNKKVLGAYASELNKVFAKIAPKVQKGVGDTIAEEIFSSPEALSIYGSVNFPLSGHFGFSDGRTRLREIVNVWTENIKLDIVPIRVRTNTIKGGFKLSGINKDYSNVLSLAAAQSVTRKGDSLPWLEWLLRFGNRAIITDYHVVFGDSFKTSRSGVALMHKKGNWSVPSEFSGTPNNNFVTRSLDRAKDKILAKMQKELDDTV